MSAVSKVFVFCKYSRKGASSRLRTLQFLPYIKDSGLDFSVSYLFDDEYLGSLYSGKKISKVKILKYYLKRFFRVLSGLRGRVFWIEYELFPYMPAVFERFLRLVGIRYIVDYDDAVFHNYDISKSKLVRFFLSHKINVVMRYSYCVIAGNSYLAEKAKRAGAKNVVIIPTVIDIDRYCFAKKMEKQSIVIGWIGSPSTQKYIIALANVFKILADLVEFKLLLVGASPDIVKSLPGVDVKVESWSEASEVESIQSMQIGIMPLPEGPWEKGKCGYKLIQYMACGVPVVASPVGVNVEIIESSGSGVTAETESEWVQELLLLCGSAELRKSYGASGRYSVETRYSVQAQYLNLKTVLESAYIGEKSI